MALKFLNNGVFSGDVSISTSAYSQLDIISSRTGATDNIGGVQFYKSSTLKGQIFARNDGKVFIATNGNTVALTLDESQNATFAGNVILTQPTSKISGGGSDTGRMIIANSDTTAYITLYGSAYSGSSALAENIQVIQNSAVTATFSENNRLGVGIASPAYKLHVHNPSNVFGQTSEIALGVKSNDNNDNPRVVLQAIKSGTNMGSLAIQTLTSNTLTEKVRIKQDGNVGIGTTSPGAKLHIQDTSGANIILNSATGAVKNGIYMTEGTTSTPKQVGAYMYYDGSSNKFNIATGVGVPTDKLTILRDSGNVGVGTTSPGASLHVAGPIASAPTGTGVLMGMESNFSIIHLNGASGGIIDFSTSGVDRKGRILYNNSANYMQIQTNGSDKVRIDSSGNVGIGTTSPSRDGLNVFHTSSPYVHLTNTTTGDTASDGGYLSMIGNELRLGNQEAGGALSLFTNNTTGNGIYILANGNVGIGTTSPSQKLQVEGNSWIKGIYYDTSGDAGSSGNVLTSTATGTTWVSAGTPGSGIYLPLAGGTMAGQIIMGDASGSYSHELKFSNNTYQAGIDFQNSGELRFIDRSGGRESITFNLLNGSIEARNTANTVTNFISTSGNSYFNGGNVGIGTTSPGTLHGVSYGTTRLHVDGGTDRGQMIIEGDSFAGIVLSDNGATANQRVFITQVNDTKYSIKPLNDNGTSTAGGHALTILHGGNVGIGTTSPDEKLSVNGNIFLQGNDDYIAFNTSASSGHPKIKMNSDADFSFLNTAGTNTFHIENGGNVGIGTTTPSAKLNVVGTASAAAGVIQAKSTYSGSSYFSAFRSAPSDGSTTANSGLWMGAISDDNAIISSGAIYRSAGQWRPAGTTASVITMSAGTIGFSTNSGLTADTDFQPSSRMTINTSGNVGIGTTSPVTKFHVSNTTRINDAYGLLLVENTDSSSGFSTTNSAINIKNYHGTSQFMQWEEHGLRIGSRILTNGGAGNVIFTAGADSEKMRITSGGNVGIGTTNPASKLTVGGNASGFSTTMQVWQDGETASSGDIGGKAATFFGESGVSNSSIVNIYSTNGYTGQMGGEIGFGGKYASNASVAQFAKIRSFKTNASNGGVNYGGGLEFWTRPNGSAAVPRMTILGDGNVGIGTTNPGAKLQVYSTATRDIFISGHGTQAQNTWQAEHAFFISAGQGVIIGKANAGNDTNRLHILYNTANGDANYLAYDTSNVAKIKLSTNGDSYLNGGNVGIGTTSIGTNDKLLIKTSVDNSVAQGLVIQRSANTDEGYINYNGGGFQFRSTDGDPIVFGQVSNERVRISDSGNVGIGTTNPGARLHVENEGGSTTLPNTALIVQANTSSTISTGGGTAIEFKGVSSGGNIQNYQQARIRSVGQANNNAHGFAIDVKPSAGLALTERLSLNSGGTLTLSSYGAGILKTNSSGTVGLASSGDLPGGPYLPLSAGSSYPLTNNLFINNGFTLSWGADTTKIAGNSSTNELSLKTASTTRVHINSSGNVGIGTTTPGSKLDIVGIKDATNVTISAPLNTVGGGSLADYSEVLFDNSQVSGTSGQAYLRHYANSHNDSEGALAFGVTTTGGTMSEALRIRGSGNVGIGTTNPGEKLTVAGNIEIAVGAASAQGIIFDENGTQTMGIKYQGGQSGNPIDIFRYQDNTTKVRFLENGNVGIGTTSPDVKLEVVEASPTNGIVADFVNSTNAGGTIAAIKLSNADSEACDVVLGANRTGANFGSDFFISLSDGVDGTNQERLRIKENGNVGIGTTNPGAKLEVVQGAGGTAQNIINAGETAFRFSTKVEDTSTNTPVFRQGIYHNNTENATIAFYRGGSSVGGFMTFQTQNGNERMRIDSVGAVLIGGLPKIDTATKLQVGSNDSGVTSIWSNADDVVFEHNTNLGLTFATPNDAAATIAFADPQSVQAGWIQYLHDVDAMRFGTNGNNERMRINASGNVGIGTTAPTAKLHVQGNSNFLGSINAYTGSTSNKYLQILQFGGLTYISTGTTNETIYFGLGPIANTTNINCTGTATATNFILSSDEKLKKNIKDLEPKKIDIKWKSFELKLEPDHKRVGVIAQELEKTNPEFVREDVDGIKSVAYIDLLIAKIAELEARLEKAGI